MPGISNRAGATTQAASIAAKQGGVISRRQLEACGVSEGVQERLVRDGHLHPVFSTVFALGHPNLGPRARMRAAALACPGAVISHRSAAALLGIGEVAPVVVDLISTEQRGRKIDGIRSHRVPFPAPGELDRVHGIPCTNVARTVVDLAGVYGEDKVRETVEMAAVARKLDVGAVDAVLSAGPRRRGAPSLRRVLEEWRPVAETARYSTVRSLFEARLLPLIARAGLPLPEVNEPVETAEKVLEVDLLWPAHRFVVEADSRRFHATEVAFERDHRRDRELKAANYNVLRVTWREAEKEPRAVFAVIRDELDRRRRVAARPG